MTKAMVVPTANLTGVNAQSAAYKVPFNSEVYDDGGYHDNVSNNTRLTVPAGVSFIRYGFTISVNNVSGSGIIAAGVQKNGSATDYPGSAAQLLAADVPNSIISSASGPLPVTEGDYFELALYLSGDNDVTIVGSQTAFWIEAIVA